MASGTTSGGVSNRQVQRIQRDIQAFNNSPLPFIQNLNFTSDENGNQLTGVLIGPDNTPYAGGHFRFVIVYPPEYPFKPPEFHFKTAICHPNILSGDGFACHDQLNATWAPSITLATFFTEIHELLQRPNYDVPVENDSLEKNADKARLWTQQFAQPQSDE